MDDSVDYDDDEDDDEEAGGAGEGVRSVDDILNMLSDEDEDEDDGDDDADDEDGREGESASAPGASVVGTSGVRSYAVESPTAGASEARVRVDAPGEEGAGRRALEAEPGDGAGDGGGAGAQGALSVAQRSEDGDNGNGDGTDVVLGLDDIEDDAPRLGQFDSVAEAVRSSDVGPEAAAAADESPRTPARTPEAEASSTPSAAEAADAIPEEAESLSGLRALRTRSVNLVNEILTSFDDGDDDGDDDDGDDGPGPGPAGREARDGDEQDDASPRRDAAVEPLLSRGLRIASSSSSAFADDGTRDDGPPAADDSALRRSLVDDLMRRLDDAGVGPGEDVASVSERVSFAALVREGEQDRVGVPQCLAVAAACIAVGYSSGTVFVVLMKTKTLLQQHSLPQKERAQAQERADLLVSLSLPFQIQSQHQQQRRKMGASAVGFSPDGSLLLAGYESGLLMLWDVAGRRALSEMQNVHSSPVMSVCSVSGEAAGPAADGGGASTVFITADTGGTAHVHAMSRKQLLRKVSLSSRMLLDGRKGIIHSVVPLPPAAEGHPQVPAAGRAAGAPSDGPEPVLVAIALTDTVLIVRFAPEPVSTLLRIRRPDGAGADGVVHVSWRRRHGAALRPALVAAWGAYVEVIVVAGAEPAILSRTAVPGAREPPRTVGWLDDRFVAVVGAAHAEVFEEEDREEQEQEEQEQEQEGCGAGPEDLEEQGGDAEAPRGYRPLQSVRVPEAPAASQAVLVSSLSSTSQRCFCHSSCAAPGAAVFWQGMQNAVWRLSLRSWPQRVGAHRQGGRAGAALSAAVAVHWRRARALPGHWPPPEATAAVIQELLREYAQSVVAALGGENADRLSPGYVRGAVSSVVEACVLLPANLGVLWDLVCPRFLASPAHRGDFLEVLAVYISRGLLPQASPEAVQALVEHHVLRGQTALVESCVVQLDIASLDFNQLMILCRKYDLFNVMIHLLTGGLRDYATPANELLRAARAALRGPPEETRGDGEGGECEEEVDEEEDGAVVRSGGTLLVYLYQCLLGRRYPPGRGAIDDGSAADVRRELLALVLAEEEDGARLPWLRLLLSLDPEGTFRILRAALEAAGDDGDDAERRLVCASMLRLIDLEEEEERSSARFPSPGGRARGYGHGRAGALAPALVLEIYASEGAGGVALAQGDVLKTMTSLARFGDGAGVEAMLARLVCGGDPAGDAYVEHARTLAEAYQLPGVAIVTATVGGRPDAKVQALLQQGGADADLIFSVLQRALDWDARWARARGEPPSGAEPSALGRSVISRVDALISLDGGRTARLILRAFGQDASFHVLRGLASPELQFEYIRSVMNELGVDTFGAGRHGLGGLDERGGSGAFADMLARSGLEVTPELSELYIRLLCRFRPGSVMSFLQAQQVVFRPDVCVQYCEEAGVMDAAAKLYEDMGFDARAIECLLRRLDPPLDEVEEAVRAGEELSLPARLKVPEQQQQQQQPAASASRVPALLRQAAAALDACISLSVRTGHRSASADDATDVWFRVLERLVSRIRGLNTRSDLYAMYSLLMNDVLTAMMSDGQVPRDVVFARLSREFGGSRFGGFRGVLTGVLCAAEFEYVIYRTTRSILEADTYDKLRRLHSQRCRALPASQIRLVGSGEDRR